MLSCHLFFCVKKAVCRPACLLHSVKQLKKGGRSLWWLWEFFRFLLRVWRPSLVFWICCSSNLSVIFTFQTGVFTHFTSRVSQKKDWSSFFLSAFFCINTYLTEPEWVEVLLYCITVIGRSLGVQALPPPLVFSLMSDHGKYPLN